jgi:hypothetical protein
MTMNLTTSASKVKRKKVTDDDDDDDDDDNYDDDDDGDDTARTSTSSAKRTEVSTESRSSSDLTSSKVKQEARKASIEDKTLSKPTTTRVMTSAHAADADKARATLDSLLSSSSFGSRSVASFGVGGVSSNKRKRDEDTDAALNALLTADVEMRDTVRSRGDDNTVRSKEGELNDDAVAVDNARIVVIDGDEADVKCVMPKANDVYIDVSLASVTEAFHQFVGRGDDSTTRAAAAATTDEPTLQLFAPLSATEQEAVSELHRYVAVCPRAITLSQRIQETSFFCVESDWSVQSSVHYRSTANDDDVSVRRFESVHR